jgi:hypothetical protein
MSGLVLGLHQVVGKPHLKMGHIFIWTYILLVYVGLPEIPTSEYAKILRWAPRPRYLNDNRRGSGVGVEDRDPPPPPTPALDHQIFFLQKTCEL